MRLPLLTGLLTLALPAGLLLAGPFAEDLQVPNNPYAGGEGTVFNSSRDAFARPLANLPTKDLRSFTFGNKLFNTNWVTAPASVQTLDGLGPTFNRVSCSGCHFKDGRGRPPLTPEETRSGDRAFSDPKGLRRSRGVISERCCASTTEAERAKMMSMLIRLSVEGVAEDGGPKPHPAYGRQLNDKAIAGVPAEGQAAITYETVSGTYADGTSYTLQKPVYTFHDLAFGSLDGVLFSPRVAPAVHGMGLLEAIPEATLLAWADPEDADGDGISGRVNRVWDAVAGKESVGRFGWKANVVTLRQQDAGAALGDIGITSSLAPAQNCPEAQTACRAAPHGGEPELSDMQLEKLVFYTHTLAVPARRGLDDPEVQKGAGLFEKAGCVQCHRPSVRTGDHPVAALAHQEIQPFTDLLLHDMGEGLADHRPDYQASGSEWRTPPLWGIGLVKVVNQHTRFLHDGRARNLEEAILWHGGEAEAAQRAFIGLNQAERAALIAFLNSL